MLGVDLNEFLSTMDKVLKQGAKDDKQIVFENGKEVMKAVIENSSKNQGHLNAGWFPAWNGLGLSGAPNTSQPYGKHKGKGDLSDNIYVSEGEFEDNTKDSEEPHVIFKNKTYVLTDAGKKREEFKKRRAAGERISKEEREAVKGQRSKIAYPYLLNRGKLTDEKGQPTALHQKGFFSKTVKAKKFEFKNFYKDNFKRHSAK
jgi:hypothetical protein